MVRRVWPPAPPPKATHQGGRDLCWLKGGKKGPVRGTGRVLDLFPTVLFAMGLHGIIRVGSGMNNVTPCGMSMVCRLFMVSRLMMLGGFRMMTGGVRKVV
jgi:hypothetical protein